MRRLVALLFSITLVACGGPAAETAQVSPTPSASEPSVAPSPSADAWLDAIPSYTYQKQACDPADPRLARMTLPPKKYREGRIAAACVALEWLDNKDLKLPTVEIFVPDYVSSAARRSIERSAKWQLRVISEHRTFPDVTPTVFMFDSKRFLCSKDHIALATNFFVYRDCVDLKREWTCEDNPDTALGATPDFWSGDKPRAGVISFACGFNKDSLVISFKFYMGLLACDLSAMSDTPFCSRWQGAPYIFGLYAEELGSAEAENRAANLNLCQQGGWMSWCPRSARLFRGYISSSNWLALQGNGCWPGSDPYGDDGSCDAAQIMSVVAINYAFEWVTAHYGIDVAYGIINATLQAGTDKERYLRILSKYLGMSTDDFFAAIDTYVVTRLGDRIR